MGLQPVFALMHFGAQGDSIIDTAFHLFLQDGGGFRGFCLRGLDDEFVVDGQDGAIRSPLARML